MKAIMKKGLPRAVSRITALFLVSVMLLAAFGCAAAPAAVPDQGGAQGAQDTPAAQAAPGDLVTVTMAMGSAWTTLFPFVAGNQANNLVQSFLFDELATSANDGVIYPRLVDRWDVSEDGRIFTLHMIEGSMWHDGVPVTAHDVAWTYRFFSNADAQLDMRPAFRFIEGTDDDGVALSTDSIAVTAIDDRTVEVVLKRGVSPETFFSAVSVPILPQHLLGDQDPTTIAENPFWQSPIGSGPMVFESTIEGDRLVFTANANYHLGAPEIDRFVIMVVARTAMLAGLMSGDVDLLAGGAFGNLLLDDFLMARDVEHLVTMNVGSFIYEYMVLNHSDPLMTWEVRMAIDRAINKQRLIDELMGGYAQLTAGIWAEGHPFHHPGLEADNFNPDEARAFLAQANWDSSNVLTLGVSATNFLNQNAAVLIQQDLADVGINVDIQLFDIATLIDVFYRGEIAMGMISNAPTIEPNTPDANLFIPGSPHNFANLTTDRFANYFSRGTEYFTTEERLPIYLALQESVAEYMVYSYLWVADVLFAHNRRIGNLNPFNFILHMPIWEWTVN